LSDQVRVYTHSNDADNCELHSQKFVREAACEILIMAQLKEFVGQAGAGRIEDATEADFK